MPNWCYGQMRVKGSKEDKEKFLDLFLSEDDRVNATKDKYFARTWLNEDLEQLKNELNQDTTIIDFYCAWSVYSCMISGYPDGIKCLFIQDVSKELKLNIQLVSEEQGCCFREFYQFDNGELVIDGAEDFPEDEYNAEELYKEYCNECEGEPKEYDEWCYTDYQYMRDEWYNSVYDKFSKEFC